jgi:hypothetical protein
LSPDTTGCETIHSKSSVLDSSIHLLLELPPLDRDRVISLEHLLVADPLVLGSRVLDLGRGGLVSEPKDETGAVT